MKDREGLRAHHPDLRHLRIVRFFWSCDVATLPRDGGSLTERDGGPQDWSIGPPRSWASGSLPRNLPVARILVRILALSEPEPRAVPILCPYCRNSLNIKEAKPGHHTPRCPACGKTFQLIVPD